MNDASPWVDPEPHRRRPIVAEPGPGGARSHRGADVRRSHRAGSHRRLSRRGSIPLQRERDVSLPGPGGQIPCRLYLPDDIERPALLVYAHGGAFVQGSLGSWHHLMRDFVRQSGVAALSVDYRLAPEHRFPAGVEDMAAVTRLMAREGAGLGIDPSRLAVGGDSAGACLALGAALAMRDADEQALRIQLLIYGCYSTDTDSPSWRRFGQGTGLSRSSMRWAWETYLQAPEDWQDWRAAPLNADLSGIGAGSPDRWQPGSAARRQQQSAHED